MAIQTSMNGTVPDASKAATIAAGMGRLTGPFTAPPGMDTPTASLLCKFLALLLVRAGEVVSMPHIIEELWGEHPPRTAVGTLHTYVLHLRERIHTMPKEVLESVNGSYRLNITRQSVDALAFTDMVRGVEESNNRDQLVSDLARLEFALGLVPGHTLVNVTCGPQLQRWVAGFEEVRLQARQLKIENTLKLGRHRQVLAELSELCQRYPFHEGLQARLMLALYRSERSTEALTRYRDLRTVLSSEFGTEPNPSVRALHQSILQNDKTLLQDHLRLF